MSVVSMFIDSRAAQATSGENWNDLKLLDSIDSEVRTELGRMYRFLDRLAERRAELRGPVVLPKARNRTATQEKVARCPRCRGEVAA